MSLWTHQPAGASHRPGQVSAARRVRVRAQRSRRTRTRFWPCRSPPLTRPV